MNSEEFLGTDSDLDYQLLLNAKKLTIEKVLLRYLCTFCSLSSLHVKKCIDLNNFNKGVFLPGTTGTYRFCPGHI